MTNVLPFSTTQKFATSGTSSPTSILPGSNRASFVERVLHAARADKAAFGVGDKVRVKCDPAMVGTIHVVYHTDTVRYRVSFGGIICIVEQRELEQAGA